MATEQRVGTHVSHSPPSHQTVTYRQIEGRRQYTATERHGIVVGRVGEKVETRAKKEGRMRRHTSWQVLLVGEHEEQTVLHLPIAQNPMQLLFCLVYPLPILAIHNEHETLCPSVVVSPQRSNLVLSADVPHVEFDIFIRHRLDVKTDWLKARVSPSLICTREPTHRWGLS